MKTMLERGVPLCFSTDAPATSWAVPSDPFPCLKGGVTARPGTALTAARRKGGYRNCRGPVHPGGRPCGGYPQGGQLKAGFHADFAVLSEDLLEVDSDRIDQVYVLQTYSNGMKVYDKEAAK